MEPTKNQPTSTPPNPPGNPKSKLLSIVLGAMGLIIVLAIIGLGGLLASHTWNPKWNPLKQTPPRDKVIREDLFKRK